MEPRSDRFHFPTAPVSNRELELAGFYANRVLAPLEQPGDLHDRSFCARVAPQCL